MGFTCVSLKMPKCLSMSLVVLNLVGWFRFMVMPFLKGLGLVKPLEIEPDHHHPPEDSNVLVVDGLSIISMSIQALTCLIKNRLQVVQYGDLLLRSSLDVDKEDTVECSVCLECVDRSHMVRELVNCCHVFHQGCLDTWVDEGQVTCPLCRSMLFPARGCANKLNLLAQ